MENESELDVARKNLNAAANGGPGGTIGDAAAARAWEEDNTRRWAGETAPKWDSDDAVALREYEKFSAEAVIHHGVCLACGRMKLATGVWSAPKCVCTFKGEILRERHKLYATIRREQISKTVWWWACGLLGGSLIALVVWGFVRGLGWG